MGYGTKLESLFLSLAAALTALPAVAATGVCDSNPPTSSQACVDAIQSAGGVINDIFKDKNGLTGPQLPVFAQFFNNWPGCTDTSWAGCAGESTAPYECPGSYVCNGTVANTVANATAYYAALDHKWWHPCRLVDHNLVNGCPNRATTNCVADGDTQGYYPWEGAVFDLGGPANKVAIFAQNDHGPQPCESIEYTVFLSDNPFAQTAIDDPATTGTDPQKWNRAVLQKIYTHGWFTTRSPSPGNPTYAACGDTANYAVEDDSFVQVHGLPCGITFRYTAIVAGYDGKEFPACAYHSSEGEIDAVAGLTEEGSGVCPDSDKDGFVDCSCPGAPSPCDCNDSDPSVYPGAPEACDATTDKNCDGNPGACPTGLFCYQSVCVDACKSGEFACPKGATCTDTTQGKLCVADDCTTGGCAPGSVCDPTTKTCKPACDGVTCPWGQSCKDGACVDLCAGVQCPAPKQCQLGECKVPCSCYASDVACSAPSVCDKGGTEQCVTAGCLGVTCNTGEHCDPQSGQCVGLCAGVTCPQGQKCAPPNGCVPLCEGVTCAAGQECNPATGQCEDTLCNPICLPPKVCVAGQCVLSDAGVGGTGGSTQDAGPDASAGSSGSPPKGGTSTSGDDGGCGCRAPASSPTWPAMLLAFLGLVGLGLRRRSRR
jgi:MYXO-CTERM domain-containing protein